MKPELHLKRAIELGLLQMSDEDVQLTEKFRSAIRTTADLDQAIRKMTGDRGDIEAMETTVNALARLAWRRMVIDGS